MPFTPLHFGPGFALKSVSGRWFSVTVFCFAQVLIDLEPGWFMLQGSDYIHRFLHTYLGATLVFVVSWWAGRPVGEWALRVWNAWLSPAQARWLAYESRIPWSAAGAGAFVGAYSHVAIDSIMHGDMEPFAPLWAGNPSLLVVSVETLQWICVAAGVIAVAILAFLRWQALKGKPVT